MVFRYTSASLSRELPKKSEFTNRTMLIEGLRNLLKTIQSKTSGPP